MKCCGQHRTSRFCPDCGKALAGSDGLAGVLAYCRRQQLAAQSRYDSHKKEYALKQPEWDSYIGPRKQQVIDKWAGWADAIERAMSDLAGL